MCALVLGVAERAMRMTAQYTCDRKQFDRAIVTFLAVGQRTADGLLDAPGNGLTMLRPATHLHEGRDDTLEDATAKFWAAEGHHHIAHAPLHSHGASNIHVHFPI